MEPLPRHQRQETPHEAFERIVGRAVRNTLTMQGVGDETNQVYLEAAHDMATVRDEWDRSKFTGSLELIVHDRIARLAYEEEVSAMGERPVLYGKT